jgi:hypothetical protein
LSHQVASLVDTLLATTTTTTTEILDAEIPQAWLVGEENTIGLEQTQNHGQQHTPILVSNLQKAKLAQQEMTSEDIAWLVQQATTSEDISTEIPDANLQSHHEENEDNQGGDTVIALDTTNDAAEGEWNAVYKDDEDDTESTSSLSPSEFEYYVREKKRLEIEESHGCALFEIPVAIVAVWRLDA